MNVQKARSDFGKYMQIARQRPLTEAEKKHLTVARQTLRMQRRPAMNPKEKIKKDAVTKRWMVMDGNTVVSSHKKRSAAIASKKPAKRNPGNTLIYGRVVRIIAIKTQPHVCDAGCKKNGHRYFHDFETPVKMYGTPDHKRLIIQS